MGKNRTSRLLEMDLSDIKFEDIRSTAFNTIEKVEEAKKSLINYNDYRVEKINAHFENNEWYFKDPFVRSIMCFNFKEIYDFNVFNGGEEREILNIAIKCWIAQELNKNSLVVVQNKLLNIYSAMIATKCFKIEDDLIVMLNECTLFRGDSKRNFYKTAVSEQVIYQFITDLTEFLDFYNREKYSELINLLIEKRNKIKIELRYRKLPSFKDTLIIKDCIDKWFEEAKQNDEDEMLKYYPIVLWWNLTSIIPMRIVEFLYIKQNCFTKKDDKYFISFPRMKHKRVGIRRKEMIYDTLPIPEELYNLFQDYIIRSKKHGESKYLISHKMYLHYFNKKKMKNRAENQMFNYHDLKLTLSKFFISILFERYKINIEYVNGSYRELNNMKLAETYLHTSGSQGSIESLINPGDLRHLAIINMMMQGYDKVEIQRLAGHYTEETQYSYFNHMESWVDIEIQKMEKEFRFIKTNNESYKEGDTFNLNPNTVSFFNEYYKKNYINKNVESHIESNYIKLDLGFCMDKDMPCPSFNWKHRGCYFCKNWSISDEEMEEKRNDIIKDLNIIYEDTKRKIEFIQSMFNVKTNYSENENSVSKKKILSTSKEIQQDIKKIAKLKVMLGGLNCE